MRLIHTAPLAAAILLAACGDSGVSDEDVAAEAAGVIAPQPGQYRVSFELLQFDAPGAPEAVKQQLQTQMGGAAEVAKPITYCLTPEQAAANGPQEMAKRMAEGDCTVARFDVSGNSISTEMQCTGGGAGPTRVVMDGQMTATGSVMTQTAEMELPGVGKIQTKTRITSERIGDCPAGG